MTRATSKFPMSFTDVTIGVIGGSGLYDLPGLKVLGEIQPETPWGKPSDAIIVSQLGDIKIGFLARHGRGHYLSPSEVPFQANIAALKSIGVKVILAFSAVGSLREEIRPRDFVVPTQLIDRTKGIRKSTFFEDGVVGHVQFGDPFTLQLTELIYKTAETVEGLRTHYNKTLICMEGPQFSTRAESHLYRSWGCDIINMSVIPESKLAAEAEIAYAMVCMATDYDCWKESEEAVTLEMVLGNLSANAENARKLVQKLIPLVHKELQSPWVLQKQGTASGSICTAPQKRNPATLAKLGYLFKIQ